MKSAPIKPYLMRAIHEWCSDQGYTPYLVVAVRGRMQVPMEYVKNGEIVLNVSYNATRNLQLGDEFVRFSARFNGVSREIFVPVGAVVSLFARETGEGMAWEPEFDDANRAEAGLDAATAAPTGATAADDIAQPDKADEPLPEPPPSGRPHLRVVK
jgi:stringent starvation protein B